MTTFVISDLHIGSRHLNATPFLEFLPTIPPHANLVLNGDIMNRRVTQLNDAHNAALLAIRTLAESQPVIWVRGNHDRLYQPPWESKIQFTDAYQIHGFLAALHGDEFKNAKPRNRPLILLFRFIYLLKRILPKEPLALNRIVVHLSFLRRLLCNHVASNAAQYAREHNLRAITCGHTHTPEERTIGDVSYVNTGSWIQGTPTYLEVCDNHWTLREFRSSTCP